MDLTSAHNAEEYQKAYMEGAFLEWPADWIIRYWAYMLKTGQPTGRVLDFGCGSGNNSLFFATKGYDVYGCDASPKAVDLVQKNYARFKLPFDRHRFTTIDPSATKLDYPDGWFDVVVANQVLYYLVEPLQLKNIIMELHRVTKHMGQIFVTMMSPKNVYFTHYLTGMNGDIAEVTVDNGRFKTREYIYRIRDADHLKYTCQPWVPMWIGHYDVALPTMRSHHFIYIGIR